MGKLAYIYDMSTERIKSFREFYPYYLEEHRKKGNRLLHFFGTSLFFLFVLAAIFLKWGWGILVGVIAAYGFAWIGHYFIEKNRPATFRYPLWSLLSDFKLYFQLLGGWEKFDGESKQ